MKPSAFARSSLMSSTAAPPSVSGDALPAVTVPYLRSNTGLSFASCSRLVSLRMPLSDVSVRSYFGGMYAGAISAVSRPSFVPAAAFMCDASASSSCAARAMWFSFAIFSADCPIVSPVVGSAIAGVIGMRSRGRIFASAPRRCPSVFALLAATSASLMPRECRIGTFESDSAPPAIAMSAWPSMI